MHLATDGKRNESNCDGPGMYRCLSGACLNASQRCDNVVDCPYPDRSDELDCNTIDNEIDTYRKSDVD